MESKKKTVMELDTEVKLQAFMAKLCEAVPHISMCGLHGVEQSKKLFSPPHRQPSTIDSLSFTFNPNQEAPFLLVHTYGLSVMIKLLVNSVEHVDIEN